MKDRVISKTLMVFAPLLCLLQSQAAMADWHQGRVTGIHFGYDGSTVMFSLSGWSRNNCTCYATWGAYMCLNRARNSFKEEFAWLLKVNAMESVVNVNINETTCVVEAMADAS